MGNGIPIEHVSYVAEGMKIKNLKSSDNLIIKGFEVSARSDSPINGYDGYLGLVLYGYDGKTSWRVNGRSCESGFIYIKKVNNIKRIECNGWNSVHGKLYKSYFGVDIDYSKAVGAGFAYKTYKEDVKNDEGQKVDEVTKRGLVFRSSTFNAPDLAQDEHKDEWHDENRSMNVVEQYWVTKAFNAWKDNDYYPKKVYCNAANWKFKRNNGWGEYGYSDSVAIEKEYEIYKKKRSEADSYEEFDKQKYYVTRYMNGSTYYLYFNAPHINEDMYGHASSDGYQQNGKYGCLRALYRESNGYTGGSGCVIL